MPSDSRLSATRRTSGRPVGPVGGVPAAVLDREGLGRSRGGLSTKLHLIADHRCRPLARVTTAGQRHDSLPFEAVMARLRIRRRGPGRPRTRPDRVLGDKAYSSRKIRSHLRRRGIQATIAEPPDQAAHRRRRGRVGGRPQRSTPRPTRTATPSNAASTSYAATAQSRCAPTNASSSTTAPSTSPRSTSGCATPTLMIHGTRPSRRRAGRTRGARSHRTARRRTPGRAGRPRPGCAGPAGSASRAGPPRRR